MDKEQVIPTLQQQERELEKRRDGKGLEEHFKLFNDLLKLKQASYTKAIIMLIVSFIHHIMSQIRQYLNQYIQIQERDRSPLLIGVNNSQLNNRLWHIL
ncbi:unnamed protein product (macronuclear) [Paramecium tetraurelia]|uniref:Uncharacterized protein n=1 Tax=Paramecium tetraurelia TaxID=5888 RepID=A0EI35_PARTE|nr:uncharacterized protein GSPATT00027303001 [Paramecium tetraurelia]CAK94976.1 unnamed protein product [Paramecium tetraurelia]|eukprot:XP_001462349.1 hypothetical protein (macronuclear) [Paramecium tetraurelia strain d4-2]